MDGQVLIAQDKDEYNKWGLNDLIFGNNRTGLWKIQILRIPLCWTGKSNYDINNKIVERKKALGQLNSTLKWQDPEKNEDIEQL